MARTAVLRLIIKLEMWQVAEIQLGAHLTMKKSIAVAGATRRNLVGSLAAQRQARAAEKSAEALKNISETITTPLAPNGAREGSPDLFKPESVPLQNETGTKDDSASLSQLLNDLDASSPYESRCKAALRLGALRDPAAIPQLVEVLRSNQGGNRPTSCIISWQKPSTRWTISRGCWLAPPSLANWPAPRNRRINRQRAKGRILRRSRKHKGKARRL